MAAVGEHRVALRHIQRRGLPATQRERAVADQRRVAEAELFKVANGVANASLKQQQANGHQVHRAYQRFAHARRAVKAAAVINGPPDGLEFR